MSKTAYMVMGRWQPLHKGHITLINKAYNKAKKESNDDFILYIIVAENQGKKDEENKNPLTKEQRVIMLSKMLPVKDYPHIQIRTNERPSGTWEDIGISSKEVKRIKAIGVRKDEVWSTNVTQNLLLEGQYTDTHDKEKKQKYNKVKIFVGSDRYEAFRKYNESNCVNVVQCGEDRGPTGKQQVFDQDEMEVANILLNIKQDLSTNLIEIPFSGSQTRDYAIDLDFNKFRDSVKVGNVTDKDAMKYMNWVREGLGFDDTIELKLYDYDESNDTYKINTFKTGQFGPMGGRKKRKTMKLKSKRKKKKKSKKTKKRNKSKKYKRKSKKIVKKNKIKRRKRKNIKKTKKK
tara:strand:- start:189 stop:1229 length:1041 start_codon:yes stop_codon:yes gene_type:complete